MKITIKDKKRAAPVEAVLCAVGLAEADERGRVFPDAPLIGEGNDDRD